MCRRDVNLQEIGKVRAVESMGFFTKQLKNPDWVLRIHIILIPFLIFSPNIWRPSIHSGCCCVIFNIGYHLECPGHNAFCQLWTLQKKTVKQMTDISIGIVQNVLVLLNETQFFSSRASPIPNITKSWKFSLHHLNNFIICTN